MKRNIFNSVLLVLIFSALVFGVVFLNNPDLFAKKSEKLKGSLPASNRYSISVPSGHIDYTASAQGCVGSVRYGAYDKTITCENAAAADSMLHVERGADFARGDRRATGSGSSIDAPFNGRLIDFRFDPDDETLMLELLDYDSLCIHASIDAGKLNRIGYNTPVKVLRGRKKYETKVTYIGYEIEGGSVDISVALPEELKLLPGEDAELEFIVGGTDKGMYLPSEAVFRDFDGSAYCLTYGENDELIKRPLVVGETFTVEEGDYLFEYIEIISGVEPDELIVVETIDANEIQPSIEELIDG